LGINVQVDGFKVHLRIIKKYELNFCG